MDCILDKVIFLDEPLQEACRFMFERHRALTSLCTDEDYDEVHTFSTTILTWRANTVIQSSSSLFCVTVIIIIIIIPVIVFIRFTVLLFFCEHIRIMKD